LVLVPDGADSILVQLEKRLRGGLEMEKDMTDDSEIEIVEKTQAEKNDPQKPLPEGASSEAESDELTSENAKFDVVEEDPDLDDDAENADATQEILDAFVEKEWNELEGRDWIDLPFELQSVDAVLSCVSSILAEDVLELQLEANSMILQLLEPGSDVGDHSQEVLRQMKNSVQEMMSRVDGFCRAMDELLEDDEDMALMNLSRLLTHPERFIQPVPQAILDEESDEPELIVEAHLQRGHSLANALRLVQGQITSTEDYAERKSDTIRNQLLYINLLLQAVTLSVTIGSFVGAIFGMNVLNGYEDSHRAFILIFAGTVGFMVCLPCVLIFMIRKMGILPSQF
jgi:magnesium transporter